MPKEEKKSLLTRIVERKPPLYWWALLNISVACLAVISWLYFVPTFNYPEVPEHYQRMIDLGRAPQLPGYSSSDAPDGKTIGPEKIHQTFTSSELNAADLTELNKTLLRNYIQNIKLEKLNYYIKGSFKVSQARALNDDDMFRKGIVVQARSQRHIGEANSLVPFLVDIEYILPSVSPDTLKHFTKGTSFDLFQVPHFCTILNVKRTTGADGETIVYLTVVPITIDPPLALPNDKTVTLTTPKRIYPAAGLPIYK